MRHIFLLFLICFGISKDQHGAKLREMGCCFITNDFHCNRSIINKVQKYYPKMKEDEIKQLIWYFSSSTNKRECIIYSDKLKEKWNEIRKVVRHIQKNCIFY